MEVNEAARIAKEDAGEVLSGEQIEEVGLDDAGPVWRVTIGFFRPWDRLRAVVAALDFDTWRRRSFKVVRMDYAGGRMLSLTRRTLQARE